MIRKHLMLATFALPLLFTAGCATRSSVEMAQNAANAADAHALDARAHADTAQIGANAAQARADQAHANAATAQARADEAATLGGTAQQTAQAATDRVAALEAQLQKTNVRLNTLQHRAVLKKVAVRKAAKHKVRKLKTVPKPADATAAPNNS